MPQRSRNRGGRPFRNTALICGLVIGIWGAGLFAFAGTIPESTPPASEHTDAIVVLTGGSGRLQAGLALLADGAAERLFVSGVYRGVDVSQLLAVTRQSPDDIEDRISIGNAIDTIENALETAGWMRTRGYTSLRLVTAAYHMPRSLLEFEDAMPDVRILPHPVFPEHVKQENWWAWPGTAALTASEYNKFLLAWLRHQLKGLDIEATKSGERIAG